MESKEKIRLYIVATLLAAIAIWYLFSSGTGSSDTVDTRIQQLENRISDFAHFSVGNRLLTVGKENLTKRLRF